MGSPYDAALSRFGYKPGVAITCAELADGTIELCLTTFGPNSRGGEARLFSATRPIAAGLIDEQVRDEIVGLIRWWDEHEMFEWARWDRSLIADPHDPVTRAALGQADRYSPASGAEGSL